MEPYNKNTTPGPAKPIKDARTSDRVWGGVVIVVIGTVLLGYSLGVEIPRWLISWPMAVIAIGVYIGARQSFRSWGWLVPVLIGVAFLLDRAFWELDIRRYIWPVAVILFGLYMIFKPRGSASTNTWESMGMGQTETPLDEDAIDAVTIFGSTKKNVLSKTFRGGEVVNFFGGTELNLSQADIQGTTILEMTQVFGGAKLIVPSNWKIQSELVSVFGGVEDKRVLQPNVDQTKLLVLRGTCVFGGIEIKSY